MSDVPWLKARCSRLIQTYKEGRGSTARITIKVRFFGRPRLSHRYERGYSVLLLCALACATRQSPAEPGLSGASSKSSAATPRSATSPAMAAQPSPMRRTSPAGRADRLVLPPADTRPAALLPASLTATQGLMPAPSICTKTSAALPHAHASCGAQEQAVEALSRALVQQDPIRRDAALFELEGCATFPAGFLRALRADLFRICADKLVTSFFTSFKQPVAADVTDALIALQVVSRLERAAQPLPAFSGDGSTLAVTSYMERTVRPWLAARLDVISTLERESTRLAPGSYADAVASIALSLAAERSYAHARGVRIPEALKKNYESRTRFYASLDTELAKFKARKGALLLRAAERIALQGVHRGVDADRWYSFFSARDLPLRLEAPPLVVASSASERVVASVPAFYAQRLFAQRLLDDPRLFRLLAESGIPPESRRRLEQRARSAADAEVLAYFHAALAQRSAQPLHWNETVRTLEAANPRSPSAELLLATARSALLCEPASEAPGPACQLASLDDFAETSAPARLRAFALSNAAVFATRENTLAGFERAAERLSKARALAPDLATQRCLVRLESGLFLREDAPCELPLLP
jgi:hypothetical protein